jgi:hypothetical protein
VNESIITVLRNEIPHLEIVQTGAGNPDFSSSASSGTMELMFLL